LARVEKPKWKLAAVVIAVALAFAYLLFGDNGVLHVRQLKAEKVKLEKQIFVLEQTKKALQREIERLGSNPEAIEQVIREEMGLIREDETVFVFPPGEERGEP